MLLHSLQHLYLLILYRKMVQCWLLYRRDADSVCIQKKEQLNLRLLKCGAATCLVMYGDLTKKKVGRPSSLDGIAAALPPLNIRKHGIRHWSDMVDTRGLCRNGGCKGKPISYVQSVAHAAPHQYISD